LPRDSGQNDPAPGPRGRDGECDARIVPGRLERDIDAPAARRLRQGGVDVVGVRVEDDVSTHYPGGLASVPQRLDGDDLSGTCGSGQLDQTQPDGPAADDGNNPTDPRFPQVVGVQRHSERFEHRRVGVAQAVGYGVQQRRGPGEKLAQTAVVAAVPCEADRRAEVPIAFQTLLTRSARARGVDRYASPIVGPALDDPSELVPEHQRMRELSIPDAAVSEPVQVGATKTHRRHADKALARARGRPVLIGNPNISHTVQPGHLHGRLTALRISADVPRTRRATSSAAWLDARSCTFRGATVAIPAPWVTASP